MTNIINWIKNNKLTVILLLIIGWLIISSNISPFGINLQKSSNYYSREMLADFEAGIDAPMKSIAITESMAPFSPDTPPTDSANRLVIRDTSLSLQVADVAGSISQIEAKTTELGGFLVNSNLNRPEEAATGNIVIRIPEESRTQALEYFKSLSIKVVSESVSGRDVTDQYEDINAKIDTLNVTKAKFESILESTEEVQYILQTQREIINLQTQIDNLKGRQEYLEKSARLSKITIYLATDDLALPYAPEHAWRPEVVFKLAVRSLIGNLRQIGNLIIWIIVYTPIWLPILLLGWYIKKKKSKKISQEE